MNLFFRGQALNRLWVKINPKCYLPIGCVASLLFASCSSSKSTEGVTKINPSAQSAREQSLVVNVESQTIREQFQIIDPGPTKKFNPDFFVDRAKDFGLDQVKIARANAVDFNDDGYTDLVVLESNYARPQFLAFNPGNKKFEAISHSPFKTPIMASFLLFADFDQDGLLDLLAATLNQEGEMSKSPLTLMRASKREGQIFYQEQKDTIWQNEFLAFPTTSVALLDFDLDGQLDIYVGNWIERKGDGPRPVPDRLYRGQGFKFSDVSYLLEKEHVLDKQTKRYLEARPTQGVSICDINQDGWPDILVANGSGAANRMWINPGVALVEHFATGNAEGPKAILFKDMAGPVGLASDNEGALNPTGGGNTFYCLCGDYNDDGYMDVATGEVFHSYDIEGRDRSAILTGGPTLKRPPLNFEFIRSEYIRDYGPSSWTQADRRATWFDFNNDSFLDIAVQNSGFPPHTRLVLFEQESHHAFSDVAAHSGVDVLNPTGPVLFDVNRDGFLDMLIGQSGVRTGLDSLKTYLFVNLSERPHRKAVTFYLQGRESNRNAIGSLVMLKTKLKTMRRYVQYSYGHLPDQDESGVHFGIGATNLDSVEVRWPSLVAIKSGGQQTSKLAPRLKRYDLSKFQFSGHVEITLCESGKYFKGRGSCF